MVTQWSRWTGGSWVNHWGTLGRRASWAGTSASFSRSAPLLRSSSWWFVAAAVGSWRLMAWVPRCKSCNDKITGWVTYHEEEGEIFVAYCYSCTDRDPATNSEDGKADWTLRIRCDGWLADGEQCGECWQSCRTRGSSAHMKCLKWFGWGKSRKRLWYCPKHTREKLGVQDRAGTECDCCKKYPDAADVPERANPLLALPPARLAQGLPLPGPLQAPPPRQSGWSAARLQRLD